jgi:hypothetical protein
MDPYHEHPMVNSSTQMALNPLHTQVLLANLISHLTYRDNIRLCSLIFKMDISSELLTTSFFSYLKNKKIKKILLKPIKQFNQAYFRKKLT